MPMEHMVKYSQQLLEGIHACHVRMILHRDLKPQNILIGQAGLKICDFGLARICTLPIKPYTHDVLTLWYRAPEILLGSQKYGPEVDMWSAGCIVGEMATGIPLFSGDSEFGTIIKQMKLLGTPNEETWPGVDKLDHWKSSFPKWTSAKLKPISEARPQMGREGLHLLTTMLCMNPEIRSTSRRAKNHEFFRHQGLLLMEPVPQSPESVTV